MALFEMTCPRQVGYAKCRTQPLLSTWTPLASFLLFLKKKLTNVAPPPLLQSDSATPPTKAPLLCFPFLRLLIPLPHPHLSLFRLPFWGYLRHSQNLSLTNKMINYTEWWTNFLDDSWFSYFKFFYFISNVSNFLLYC